jgi:hypothetical protein
VKLTPVTVRIERQCTTLANSKNGEKIETEVFYQLRRKTQNIHQRELFFDNTMQLDRERER